MVDMVKLIIRYVLEEDNYGDKENTERFRTCYDN